MTLFYYGIINDSVCKVVAFPPSTYYISVLFL